MPQFIRKSGGFLEKMGDHKEALMTQPDAMPASGPGRLHFHVPAQKKNPMNTEVKTNRDARAIQSARGSFFICCMLFLA